MSSKAKQNFAEIISMLFIFLFVYAAVSKWIDFPRFKVQLGQSPLLSSFTDEVAWIVPGMEIFIAGLLFFHAARIFGLYASLCIMVLFSSYIIAITRFSDFVPCSCGGVLQNMSWNQHLIFNFLFMILAITGILLQTPLRKNSKHLLQ